MIATPQTIYMSIPEVVAMVLVCLGLGAAVGHGFTHRPQAEAPAAAVVQRDGSVILERNPPKAYPVLPVIPDGDTVTRITSLDLEPVEPLRKIRVDLVQIQTAEGSRMIAATPDGRIRGGADWTGPAIPPPRVYRWQAQAVRAWDAEGRGTWGGSVGYTRGPMVGTVTVLPGCIQAGIGLRW